MDVDVGGWRVLLVEDEFVLALGLSDVLLDLGAEAIGPVASVDDALQLIARVPEMDAAVLDVNLGDEVVYPVADALTARGVPFLFCTANPRAALPARFSDVPLCRKPFGPAQFGEALRGLRAATPAPHAD